MTDVMIDPLTGDKLSAVREPVRLIDAQGKILGTFSPADDSADDVSLVPPMSVEEMRRLAAEPGGRTLQEIFRDLQERG